MALAYAAPQARPVDTAFVPDAISGTMTRSWDELFGMSAAAREDFQLRAARQRFEQLAPLIRVLKAQADAAGVTRIAVLDDLVPLLFNHSTYKAYPMSLIEHGRFGLLTKWLGGVTSIDLSHVDASACTGIDDWLDLLERERRCARSTRPAPRENSPSCRARRWSAISSTRPR